MEVIPKSRRVFEAELISDEKSYFALREILVLDVI